MPPIAQVVHNGMMIQVNDIVTHDPLTHSNDVERVVTANGIRVPGYLLNGATNDPNALIESVIEAIDLGAWQR